MSMQNQQNSYSNPAFCQQSEFYGAQRCKSPPRSVRQSPVGAQETLHILDTSTNAFPSEPLPPKPGPKPTQRVAHYEEQEFYEEMIVDDTGAVQEKKFVVVHNDNKRYASVPVNDYAEESRNRMLQRTKTRYEYIPMQEHDRIINPASPNRIQYHEEVEASTGVIHRYAVIPTEDQTVKPTIQYAPPEPPKPSGRYALVPVEEVPNRNRYAVVTQEEIKQPQPPTHRYEYIQQETSPQKYQQRIITSPQPPRRVGNPIATQKLHELLTTPKKKPESPRPLPLTPMRSPSFVTPNRPQIIRGQTPRAQQKLNYAISTRQTPTYDKRHTAIVAPICSSPVQSVYSETTFSNKTDSWRNLSINKPPVQATLTISAFMMILCGGVTTGLCFYMISFMGRMYFLDFGAIAGFSCLLLGLLGFRSRNVYWLPNRNYISGYFILSVFSLLTCAGLLVLLFMQPKPGTPLADMTSGAVCGISGLSLLLASLGVVASYCCKVPPPDNRVQHCAQGFSV